MGSKRVFMFVSLRSKDRQKPERSTKMVGNSEEIIKTDFLAHFVEKKD